MRERKRITVRIMAIIFAFVLVASGLSAFGIGFSNVYAEDDTVTIEITAEFQQTDAREQLALINQFRQGKLLDKIENGEAVWMENANGPVWALAQGVDGEYVDTESYKDLEDLEYDYVLEEIAMQRAMETALRFAHDRPNGGDCFSLIVDGYRSSGENLAYGFGSGSPSNARAALEQWAETTYSYGGQGHRRNMLGRGYTCVGVAHVVVKTTLVVDSGANAGYTFPTELHFWVQEFGYSHAANGKTQTPANNSATTKNIEVQKSQISKLAVKPQEDSISIVYGKTEEIKDVKSKITLEGTAPRSIMMYSGYTGWETVTVDHGIEFKDEYTYTSATDTIASTSGNNIIANKVGSTTVKVSSTVDNTKFANINVTVEPESISNTSHSVTESGIRYTGSARTPKIKVTHNGITLTEGTDYTVSYSNNINAGTAKYTLTGKGNFKDTVSGTFAILPADVNDANNKVVISNIVEKTYNGSKLTQNESITFNGKKLTRNTDYTVEYSNNINAGTAKAVYKFKGNYTGEKSATFRIKPANLSDSSLAASISNLKAMPYTGSAITQAPTVKAKLNGKDVTLKQGTDFKVSYSNNVNVGQATVTVTGQGNYTGTLTGNFNITRASIKNATVTGISNAKYTGKAITQKPVVKLTLGGTAYTLKQGSDYTLSYKNNVNAGTATVTITGKGNFKDSLAKTFKINPIDVTASGNTLKVTNIKDKTYTGNAIKQSETITLNGKKLTRNTDYTVAYKNNVKAGTATITYTFKGNYTGVKTSKFKINPVDINDAALNAKVSGLETVEYTSKPINQKPTVTISPEGSEITLKEGTDYTLTFKNNVVPGTATVTLNFKGNYKGTLTRSFKITKRSLDHVFNDYVMGTWQTYTGEECKLELAPYIADEPRGSHIYDLKEGVDYKITYKNNVNAGMNGEATITGIGYFTGSFKEYFGIEPLSIHREDLNVKISVSGIVNKEYNGKPISQDNEKIVVNGRTLKRNKDYTVSYERIDEVGSYDPGDRTNAGKIRITFELKGNYQGTIQRTFKITPFDISKPEAQTVIKTQDQVYLGGYSPQEFDSVTTVLNGKRITLIDYGDFYQDYGYDPRPFDVGTRKVSLVGCGNYTGRVNASYKIVPADISTAVITGVVDTPYTGKKITQSPVVEYKFYEIIEPSDQRTTPLVEGKDYKLSYKNNIKQGTATMIVKGIGNMTGTKKVTFKITNPTTIRRFGGDSRYETSRNIADGYKKDSSQAKFSSIIVACGSNYPDALSATYLAKVKKAPVLIWRDKENANVQAYIKKNLKSGGTVYLIGGKAVVDSMIANGMNGYKFVRYAGDNRFETNAKALEAAKVKSGEIIICDGLSFEGALIASAAGKPVMLVMGDTLRPSQKAILSKMTNLSITIVGNTKMVSSGMEAELKKITKNVTRIDGKNAEALSIGVAKKYFKNPKEIVLATSKDFPDGLCGGPLAIVDKGPLFLVNPDNYAATKKHCSTLTINRVTVLGGTGALSDEVAKKIVGLL